MIISVNGQFIYNEIVVPAIFFSFYKCSIKTKISTKVEGN